MEISRRSRLAARAVKGDTEAFSELYGEIYKQLYYYALANLNNSDDAADAVQDAVLDAFRSIGKLKKASSFESWMFRILSSKIKQKQKEYAHKRSYFEELDPDLRVISEGGFNRCELLEELEGLSENERLCVTLGSIAGYRSAEIAKITGMKASTVRSYISRARARMKGDRKNKDKEVTK